MQRRKPLQRKTPLRAKKGLTSRTAIRRTQPKRKPSKWRAWRTQEMMAVMRPEFGQSAFAYCASFDHKYSVGLAAEHAHHNFGRVGEPWASWREVLTPLCADCHFQIHDKGNSYLRERLRRRAIERVVWRLKDWAVEVKPCSLADDPMKWWRDFCGDMKAQGVLPPGYSPAT